MTIEKAFVSFLALNLSIILCSATCRNECNSPAYRHCDYYRRKDLLDIEGEEKKCCSCDRLDQTPIACLQSFRGRRTCPKDANGPMVCPSHLSDEPEERRCALHRKIIAQYTSRHSNAIERLLKICENAVSCNSNDYAVTSCAYYCKNVWTGCTWKKGGSFCLCDQKLYKKYVDMAPLHCLDMLLSGATVPPPPTTTRKQHITGTSTRHGRLTTERPPTTTAETPPTTTGGLRTTTGKPRTTIMTPETTETPTAATRKTATATATATNPPTSQSAASSLTTDVPASPSTVAGWSRIGTSKGSPTITGSSVSASDWWTMITQMATELEETTGANITAATGAIDQSSQTTGEATHTESDHDDPVVQTTSWNEPEQKVPTDQLITLDMSLVSEFPLTGTTRLLVDIGQNIGCIYLLGCVGTTLALNVIVWDFTPERLIQMGQEFALIGAHTLLLTLRYRNTTDLLCKLVAIGNQFCFIVLFVFILLESVQCYAIHTNVIPAGDLIGRWQNQLIGWLTALLITVPSAIMYHHHLPSPWSCTCVNLPQRLNAFSCWLNYDHNASLTTILPILITVVLATIIIEAASMDKHKYYALWPTHTLQHRKAETIKNSFLILTPLQVAAWLVGSLALHNINVALFTTVLILNITLGSAILFFHALANPKAFDLMKFGCMGLRFYCKKRAGPDTCFEKLCCAKSHAEVKPDFKPPIYYP